MLKKILVIACLWVGTLSLAYARLWDGGSLYLAPTLSYASVGSNQIRYEGFVPELAVGLRSPLDDMFFLAVEAFAGYSAGDMVDHQLNGLGLKNTWKYGLSILPGYILDHVFLGYLRLGAMNTHFSNLGENKLGYQTGLGLEVTISYTLSIRGEYDYNFYRNISGIGASHGSEYSVGLIFKLGCGSNNFC